jgi:peroxiredoxin
MPQLIEAVYWRSSKILTLFLLPCSLLTASVLPAQEKPKGLRPAPYFILPTWDGKIVKLSNLKGQVIVLEFFQTWCPDCQKASPGLEKLFKQYKDQGLSVVGISHDKEGAKAIEPFIKKYGITYPVAIGDLSIAVNYIGITPEKPTFRIPYIVLIDRKGNIVGEYEEGTHKEAMDAKLLEEQIKKYL